MVVFAGALLRRTGLSLSQNEFGNWQKTVIERMSRCV